MKRRLEERATVPIKRQAPLVLVGYTPEGRPIFRPLTPEAREVLFNGVERQARGVNVMPPPPVRPGVHRASPPRWFWGGVLALITIALMLASWLVVSIASGVVALLTWIIGNVTLIIGGGVVLTIAVALLLRRSGATFIQNNRVG